MKKPISPWDYKAELISPDEKYRAIFDEGAEIAMGAPSRGRLRLIEILNPKNETLIEADSAAASMVWSNDSKFLAFSRWRSNKKQSLCVFRVNDSKIDESPDEFIVLELHTFRDSKISGVDSPVHQPRTFSLKYDPTG